ncbi:apolipoprotein N-acyltransferase [Campylobacter sp. faydin G-24]|uniref:Apolipoprotein N-acyltransferase n=1 Tax=Campylobacter anatolicus TaxID=2829105 RepID=A0ABS5HIA8_9BACT|nr:apolipoprotein N-acyltransferase [Campylobacter anatolicus]MBR8462122.1 apolipoprotein N-acyltransferase [Campylobacter anatolicus]MBR8463760.1 apolipoprotein N-acyltransferase [Campylobacter anatolicus]
MKLRSLRFALFSLNLKFLRQYFSIKIIIKAFVGAFLLANVIFFSLIDNIFLNFISPFLTLTGIFIIINSTRASFFVAGFFTGALWFYWISFSFIYYDLPYLMPLVFLVIALIYGMLFLFASFPSFVPLRGVMLFLISYVHPFGFNWFNLEATLVLGVFDPSVRGLAFIFLAAICLSLKYKFKFIAAVICLICALQFKSTEAKMLPFDVQLINTNIAQSSRWEHELKDKFIDENLNLITGAISLNRRAIIMPESAFPAFIDHEPNLMAELKTLSKHIVIIAGGLGYENNQSYNSAYLFDNGKMRRLDKMILVPFGEEIPLPKFLSGWINRVFFSGASDFKTAKAPSDYVIDGIKIRNAICYEATRDEIYAGEFDVIIAITNNGWFVPSTQPVLQKILLKYFATKYGKTIYHSVNGSPSGIIVPKKAWIKLDSLL